MLGVGGLGVVFGARVQSALDDLLLQLEAALDLPASEAMLAARRLLKLKAMKDALEGRAPAPQSEPQQKAAWLSAALRASDATPEQSARLRAVIAGLSQTPSGWLAP